MHRSFEMSYGHDALTMIERKQEVVRDADVYRLELGAGVSQCLERPLDVCECPSELTKKRRIGHDGKCVERGEFVKHG